MTHITIQTPTDTYKVTAGEFVEQFGNFAKENGYFVVGGENPFTCVLDDFLSSYGEVSEEKLDAALESVDKQVGRAAEKLGDNEKGV